MTAVHPIFQQILDDCRAHNEMLAARTGDTFEQKTERNKRVQARYDALMAEGKHGHYETMFRVVREEVERDRLTRDIA